MPVPVMISAPKPVLVPWKQGSPRHARPALKGPLLLGEVPDGAQGPWSSGPAKVTVISSLASGPRG